MLLDSALEEGALSKDPELVVAFSRFVSELLLSSSKSEDFGITKLLSEEFGDEIFGST